MSEKVKGIFFCQVCEVLQGRSVKEVLSILDEFQIETHFVSDLTILFIISPFQIERMGLNYKILNTKLSERSNIRKFSLTLSLDPLNCIFEKPITLPEKRRFHTASDLLKSFGLFDI